MKICSNNSSNAPSLPIRIYYKSQRQIAALGPANKSQCPFVAQTRQTVNDTLHYLLQPIQAAISDISRSFSGTRANLQHMPTTGSPCCFRTSVGKVPADDCRIITSDFYLSPEGRRLTFQ
jgi:hypothetical protein